MKKFKINFFRIVKALCVVGILGLVLYIMKNHLGLIDGLDFGAGAYYYADIPEFAKYVNGTHYVSETPTWVIFALFLIWGAFMYRLWVWLESK